VATRREVSFSRLDEIMPEVDRLIDGGHTTVGNWSLAQICNHLTSSLIWSVEGYPVKLPWVLRATFGKFIKRQIFRSGKIKPNAPLPQHMTPQPGLDARAEAEALRAAISQYLANPTKRAPNPMFGALTPDETDKLNLYHAAHLLGYVLPTVAK